MGLLRLQEELAAILMEPAARQAFAQDSRGSLKARGVKGRDLELLASLVPDDLAYFAERRNVDRHHALRADAPRSVALLGRLNAYFRAHPYALEDPRDEVERFARWARTAPDVPAVLADLAAFEAAGLRLMSKPAGKAKPKVLRLQHALAPMLRSGKAEDAKPGPAAMGLLRVADDVRWFALSPLDVALLSSAGPEAAARKAGASVAQARKAAESLRKNGLLRAHRHP